GAMILRGAKRTVRAAVVIAVVGLALRAGADVCDGALSLADTDPVHGAAAMGVCAISDGSSEGLVSAAYGNSDFSQQLSDLTNGVLGVGVLASFGPNVVPQSGSRMLALSSGAARSPSDPNYNAPSPGFQKGFAATPAPPGFPTEVGVCGAPPA